MDRWEVKRLSFPLVPFSFHMGLMKEGLGVCPPADMWSLSPNKDDCSSPTEGTFELEKVFS